VCIYICVYIFDFPYVYIIITGMDPSMMAGMMLTYADVCWRMLAYAGVCVYYNRDGPIDDGWYDEQPYDSGVCMYIFSYIYTCVCMYVCTYVQCMYVCVYM
jgi:hypothetical protein